MKATGIVRRIDDLGRVVIPKEIRRTLRCLLYTSDAADEGLGLEKNISTELEQIMEQRTAYERGIGEGQEIPVSAGDLYFVVAAVPIITDGDVSGCVAFVSEDENAAAAEVTVKLCQTAAQFLSRRVAV